MDVFDELLELEHAGWRSLCDGSAGDFYGDIMTAEAKMLLANGIAMTRSQVVESLRHAPPWSSYEIDDATLVPMGADSAAIVYTGTGHRDDGDDFVALMAGTYVRDGSGWRLALYQQTPQA